MPTPNVAEVLEPFGDAELIPLPELRERLGVTRDAVERAKARGLLSIAPQRGPYGRDQLTRDEAERLALAALIAAGAALGLVVALQIIKGNPWIASAVLRALIT